MNNGIKAKGNNLIKSSDGNFGTLYCYRCDGNRNIEDTLKKGFFDSVRSRLGAGDLISAVEIKKTEDGKDEVVTASVTLVVVSRTGDKMELDVRPYEGSKIYRYDPKEHKGEEPEPLQEGPRYVNGDGQVEKDLVSGEYTVKCGGKIEYSTDNQAEANAIARGDIPIPETV